MPSRASNRSGSLPYDYDAMSYTFSDVATLETDYGPRPNALGLQDKIALFGNPGMPGGSSAAGFDENITQVSLGGFGPAYDQVKTPRVHQKLERLLVSAFSRIKRMNRAGHLCFPMNPGHCFGFNHRMIRGYEHKTTLGYLSNHSWATAIDINSRDN